MDPPLWHAIPMLRAPYTITLRTSPFFLRDAALTRSAHRVDAVLTRARRRSGGRGGIGPALLGASARRSLGRPSAARLPYLVSTGARHSRDYRSRVQGLEGRARAGAAACPRRPPLSHPGRHARPGRARRRAELGGGRVPPRPPRAARPRAAARFRGRDRAAGPERRRDPLDHGAGLE